MEEKFDRVKYMTNEEACQYFKEVSKILGDLTSDFIVLKTIINHKRDINKTIAEFIDKCKDKCSELDVEISNISRKLYDAIIDTICHKLKVREDVANFILSNICLTTDSFDTAVDKLYRILDMFS